jgi:hypothetical protein
MVARPLSPEELIDRADLAGYAQVIGVHDGCADLKFTRLLKGRPKGKGLWHRLDLAHHATVRVRQYSGSSEPSDGDWSDERAYQSGYKLLVHLSWDDENATYKTCWWNGVSIVETSTALP